MSDPKPPRPRSAADAATIDALSPYHKTIRVLSDRIVEAQRPIRVLDALKWGEDVEKRFFEKGAKELPEVSRQYYLDNPLPFDVEKKQREFYDIERDIRRDLG